MNTPLPNQIIREITPLSDKDCFYIAERYKTEFTYPIHNHSEFELNFTEKAAGVRRVVGDSSEIIGDYVAYTITRELPKEEKAYLVHSCETFIGLGTSAIEFPIVSLYGNARIP